MREILSNKELLFDWLLFSFAEIRDTNLPCLVSGHATHLEDWAHCALEYFRVLSSFCEENQKEKTEIHEGPVKAMLSQLPQAAAMMDDDTSTDRLNGHLKCLQAA